jgi:hypothetical protein
MQTIHRLLTDAMLRAAGLLAGGCVVLLLLAGARPAAAEEQAQPPVSVCKNAARDNTTVIRLLPSDGRPMMFYLHYRDGKIYGNYHANPRPAQYKTEFTAERGKVEGEFLPNGQMVLRVSLEAPYEGLRMVIAGTLREGAGSGELLTYPPVTWHAQTLPGCPKWPEDVFRKDLAQSAEAQAEAGVAKLAAANPLYACDMSSWSSTQQGSLGHQFVTDCAKKAATTLPSWATSTGPGGLAWKACEAALNNRVSAVVEAMRPTCDKEERLVAAKNRCIPIHTTPDGKIFQNTPSPFSNEGKDVQLCMNEVQACFDRNADKAGQDSCATRVAGCFDFRTKGARESAANLFCLYTPPSSGTITTRVPSGRDWTALIGHPDNSLVAGTPYAGLGVTIFGCSLPNLAQASPALARRLSFVSLDRTDRFGSSVVFRDMQPAALALGDWCAPRTTAPAAAIPIVRIPSGPRIPPVAKRPAGSSGTNLATPGRGPSGGETKAYLGGASVKRSSAGSGNVTTIQSGGGTNSAMDRLGGGPSGGVTPVYSAAGSPVKRGGLGGAGAAAPDSPAGPPKRFERVHTPSGSGGSTGDTGFVSPSRPRPVR